MGRAVRNLGVLLVISVAAGASYVRMFDRLNVRKDNFGQSEYAAAVAFDNVSWANHLAQARRWVGPSFSEPAPAKLAKQDDLPG